MVDEKFIEIAMKYYDEGMTLQEAVERTIAATGMKND